VAGVRERELGRGDVAVLVASRGGAAEYAE